MQTNRWIESSKKLFARLLNLYPRDHRADFSVSMQQVFSDQCRDAYLEKGTSGVVLLWLRVLPDLGYTAVLEHLNSPRAAWGLMEPVPNAPLPWKGVFMILLPGLVYLVSQIGQLTGETWYLTVYYRAAFFLIIPVLAVWVVSRRFPIWGLIPVGLLYKLVQEMGYQLINLHSDVLSSNRLLNLILEVAKRVGQDPLILVGLFVVAIVMLSVLYVRKFKLTRWFWIWIGSYLLLAIIHMSMVMVSLSNTMENQTVFSPNELWPMLYSLFGWNLYDLTAFLLLIFIGTLFTRRHGFFAIFILVGYMLPTMVIGTPYDLDMLPNQGVALAVISSAVLVYRGLLSIIAPIWMSRTPSQTGKKKVIIISISLALGVHAIMQFYPVIFSADQAYANFDSIVTVALDELRIICALLLAIVMYQDTKPQTFIPAEAYGVVPDLINEHV